MQAPHTSYPNPNPSLQAKPHPLRMGYFECLQHSIIISRSEAGLNRRLGLQRPLQHSHQCCFEDKFEPKPNYVTRSPIYGCLAAVAVDPHVEWALNNNRHLIKHRRNHNPSPDSNPDPVAMDPYGSHVWPVDMDDHCLWMTGGHGTRRCEPTALTAASSFSIFLM